MIIAKVELNQRVYRIITTNHADERMTERKIDKYVVAGNIIGLGQERLERLQSQSEEAIIIDKEKGFSIIIAFSKKVITVITVIDKANVFVKSKTAVEVI